jgi:hypothetical protein
MNLSPDSPALDGVVEATGAVCEAKVMLPLSSSEESGVAENTCRSFSTTCGRPTTREAALSIMMRGESSYLLGFSPLWFAGLLNGSLVEDLQHGGGETTDGLGPRQRYRLLLAPFVQALQKSIGKPHLKKSILDPSRRAPHKCIDLYDKYHYKY